MIQYDQYDDELPVFALIHSIFSNENNLYLATEKLPTVEFNRHYCGYFVEKSNTFLSLDFNKLVVKNVSYVSLLNDSTLFVNWLE